MAVNNTLSVKEYALGTTATSFPITFEYTTDDSGNAENIHCQRAMKNDDGQYINNEELAEGVAGDFTISGGNVNYIDDATQAGKYLVIYRSTPVNQLTDFIDNGNYSLEDIERALDKLTFILQERTGTPIGTYINVGVSLFFASILQLSNKKDLLNYLFASWNDILPADRPIVAGNIRSIIDAVSKAGTETIGGTKTFTYSPIINQDVSSASVSNSAAATKGFVKSYFPVTTANIGDSQVTTAKIADANVTTAKIADGNVTTGKIADGNVTNAKIASGAVTRDKITDYSVNLDKLNKARDTVYLTYDADNQEYIGDWYGGGNRIPYYCTAGRADVMFLNGGWRLHLRHNTNTVIIDYVY